MQQSPPLAAARRAHRRIRVRAADDCRCSGRASGGGGGGYAVVRVGEEQGAVRTHWHDGHVGGAAGLADAGAVRRGGHAELPRVGLWEPEAFPLAAALLGKPLVPLGLVPPSPDGGRGARANREDAAVRWLDAPGSVLYVALGSEVPLRAELVRELAHGLELAGTRFLWALRKPRGGGSDDVDGDGVLPAGFEERTRGRGLVATGWVPQFAVLAHGAVGGFLTHCGRNSLVEGLLYGHPLVMLPIFADQGPNARLMEKRKVGLQVARDDDDGSFDHHGIATAVRAVMVDEDTRSVFVANAKKVQQVVADEELQERYIDEFVQKLRSYAATVDVNSTADAATTTPAESW
ncbi:hypothetical protein U9M48_001622 [Paspalum notatum var. saurae]|uniref:UDP-glycosyltransferases domain-containing protein n=1 Tax=Paspalum notatum var. saurae TaxID=547442 RepID=A0AAQ3SD18_PASNO